MAKKEETEAMAILYEERGWTLQRIAEEYGTSKQTVSQRLARLEIQRPARPPKFATIDKARLDNL